MIKFAYLFITQIQANGPVFTSIPILTSWDNEHSAHALNSRTHCQVPEKPLHGSVTCTGDRKGASCTYTCDRGYELVGGKSKRRCSCGRHKPCGWRGEKPRCETCGSLEWKNHLQVDHEKLEVFYRV